MPVTVGERLQWPISCRLTQLDERPYMGARVATGFHYAMTKGILQPYIRTLVVAALSLASFVGWCPVVVAHSSLVLGRSQALPTTVEPVLPSLHDRLSSR
jgi:hypothetical protein